jgi:hypothetical protein
MLRRSRCAGKTSLKTAENAQVRPSKYAVSAVFAMRWRRQSREDWISTGFSTDVENYPRLMPCFAESWRIYHSRPRRTIGE